MNAPTSLITRQEQNGEQASRERARVWLAFLTIVLFLGVNFVAVRFSNRELPPFSGAALRFAAGSLLLLGIVAMSRIALPRGRALLGAALFGVLLFGANYGFLYWGMLHVPAGMASVLFATIPLLTLLFAISFGMEPFRWRGLAGAGVALIGIGVVFREQLGADVPLISLLAVFVAAVCGALAGIAVKRFPKSNPLVANGVAMAIGAALLGFVSLLVGETPRLPSLPETWLALGWLIVSAVVAFVLMVWVLARWTVSATSYSAVLMPLVTVAAAAGLAGEMVTPIFLAGSALVLLGVYVGAVTAPTPMVPAPSVASAEAGSAR